MPPRDPRTVLKVRENRLRRMAARRGLDLRKSRSRDPWSIDFGVYWVYLRAGSSQWPRWHLVTPRDGLSLDQVEVFLEAYRPQRVLVDVSALIGLG